MRLYSRLNSILNKPELIRELVDNVQLLQDLGLDDKSKALKQSIPASNTITDIIRSKPMITIVYICFFLVLLTHCIMALRLRNIAHHLEFAQQQKQPQHKDTFWVDHNVDRIHHRLNQLQSETYEYQQRIKKLNNVH